MSTEKPDARSADAQAMAEYWRLVTAILGGTPAMREAGEAFLPRFTEEPVAAYKERLRHAKFTNIFRDIVDNLAARPFSTEIAVSDGAPGEIVTFCEDVDGGGNSLHVFAGGLFFRGIAYGIDWLLVDYTEGLGEGATLAQERAAGARPIWATYPAETVLAAYSDRVDGRDQFVHVRLSETAVVREGWTEKRRERVRILDRPIVTNEDGTPAGYGPARWELWQKLDQAASDGSEWERIEEGAISIGVIPLVPFLAGRRMGDGWQLHPPMRDAAWLQIEHYQQENALKHAKNLTAFPMLSGNGVSPRIGDDGRPEALIVGPATVLYAPAEGQNTGSASWTFVEPSATSLTFLAADIETTAREMRELGRQPLTAQSGNLTVVTTAFAAEKGNSAVAAWAINLKDAMEQALVYTGMWLGLGEVGAEVQIDTDFDVGMGDDETFEQVLALRTAGEISREATIHEAKRRGILDKDYDADEDALAILDDIEDDPPPPAADDPAGAMPADPLRREAGTP